MFLLNYIIYMYIFLMFKFIGNYYGKLEHTGLLKAKVFQLRVVPYIPTPKRKDTLTHNTKKEFVSRERRRVSKLSKSSKWWKTIHIIKQIKMPLSSPPPQSKQPAASQPQSQSTSPELKISTTASKWMPHEERLQKAWRGVGT